MKTMNRFRSLILGYLILNGLLVLITLTAWAATNQVPAESITFGTPAPTSTVHALPTATTVSSTADWLTMTIPLVVPALIAGLKLWIPKLPKWALPVLAPAIGALMDWVIQLQGVNTNGAVMGALLGSAGVGLRELHDQVNQRIGPASTPASTAPVAEPPKTT